jgi:dTDP-4-amino-4,6-dideoxygalactose transaminase
MSVPKKRIFLSSPHMGGNEISFVKDAFNENWIAPLGPNVDNFEKDLASYLGVKYAAALNSGTAAIHLALIMLGVGPGDYVIVQSFTFAATVNPIIYLGATPVLVDSEAGSWNMDPGLLEEAIVDCIKGSVQKSKNLGNRTLNSVPKMPKAIIPVHLYGMPANILRITEIAKKYKIPVIEDAAEALGSKFNNKCVGTFGDLGVLSFNGNKIITTSGGGAIVSEDEKYINRARFLATQARDKFPHYQHSEIGYNYRMSNILAGIGRGQMEVIDERVMQRRYNFLFYERNLNQVNGVSFNREPGSEYFSNRWLSTIMIDPEIIGADREQVRRAMEIENIECRPLWKPMHLQPVFKGYPTYINGVSEKLFKMGLCLPSGSNMTDEDRERVLKYLKRALKC